MKKPSDRDYIQFCTKQIENHLALDSDQISIKARDFEYLSRIIKEKSDISISTSTLKRLWKGDYSLIPQPATLTALVSLLDYDDWQEFKQNNSLGTSSRTAVKRKRRMLLIGATVLAILIVTSVAIQFKSNQVKDPLIEGQIHFSAEKTISMGVPNTVVFNYDVSRVVADSFFIQQSWDDQNRELIDPNRNTVSSIYHTPGFHKAKLLANDSVIATQKVHILSNGWMPYIKYDVRDPFPTYFNLKENISEGRFEMDISNIEQSSIDINKDFNLQLNNSRDFSVSADYFSLNTKFKCDSIKPIECPAMEIMLVFDDAEIFWVSLIKKGCEYYTDYKIGEVYSNGKESNLSNLGCNIYQWQELTLTIKEKRADIQINGNSVIEVEFQQDFGKLVDIIYTFDGIGSVDYICLMGRDDKIVYQENFSYE